MFCAPSIYQFLIPRLRSLLKSEEEGYVAEMAQSQETLLERQAKMRERAKFLRDKREAERVAIVEKKLDQRWRHVMYNIMN